MAARIAQATAIGRNGAHAKRTEDDDVGAAVTVDRIAPQKIGQETYPSIEIGVEDLTGPRGSLRYRLYLHIHEHDFVAHGEVAKSDRDQSARGLRAAVRRR